MKNVTLMLAGLIVAAAPSLAATYNLTACVTTKTLGGAPVTVWGYSLNGGLCTSPGPRLTVLPTDATPLIINLTNNLPVATSIVIPGLSAPLTPVNAPDAQGRARVRAFTSEVAAGAGPVAYTWNNVPPGAYLYQSGSFPALQVQMGLYGALTKDSAAGAAYPGISYTKEVLVLYSEVDKDLPARVTPFATANYRTLGVDGYVPEYFLVNGMPYPEGLPIVSGPLNANDAVLIRLLNAGLKSLVPTMLGSYFSAVAEDGNLYPFAKRQYSVNLPPLKTIDLLWVPPANGTYPLYDRSLHLTTNGSLGGGMQSFLTVGAPASGLVAVNDSFGPILEDTVTPLAGNVRTNDTGAGDTVLVTNVHYGTLTLNLDGTFSYLPNPNFSGGDSFTYKISNGTVESNVATAAITVTAVNDAPVANPDSASTTAGIFVTIPVLANDTDVDGNPLTVTNLTAPSSGTAVLNADQTVKYTPAVGFTGPATFTYTAFDGVVASAPATVTVTVNAAVNYPPVAVDDNATTPLNVAVTINVVANDSDPNGDPLTVFLTGEPATAPFSITTAQRGTAVNQKNGTVIYTPRRNFRGTDTFSYTVKDPSGATSNTATVRVNVQ